MGMNRQLKILEYSLGALMRRKGKNLSILVVFTFTVVTLASILFAARALRFEAEAMLSGSPELIVQRLAAGRHEPTPASYAGEIASIPGVSGATPRYWGYYYDAFTHSNFTLTGYDVVTGKGGETLDLLDGTLPRETWEIAVGRGVAAARGLEVGDEVALIDAGAVGRMLEVTGMFEADSDLLTYDLVVFTNEGIKEFLNFTGDEATDLAVGVRNPSEVNTVAGKITRLFPDTRPITRTEIMRTYDAVFSWRSSMLLAAFSSALIAFLILAWDKATGLGADETREIGILKAIGWDTSDVLLMKFWEGFAISTTALLLGLILAWVHVFYLGAPVLTPVLKGWSVLFPEFRLTPRPDFLEVAKLALFTIAPYVAATVIPSWRAATTDPETVMRR